MVGRVALSMSTLGNMWLLSCEHAEMRPGEEVHLYPVPGASTDERAIHLNPGSYAEYERDRFPFSNAQLEHANEPRRLRQHRIAIRDEHDEVTGLARLRHELEHARQHRSNPASYTFMQTVLDALSRAFHAAPLETIEGTNGSAARMGDICSMWSQDRERGCLHAPSVPERVPPGRRASREKS